MKDMEKEDTFKAQDSCKACALSSNANVVVLTGVGIGAYGSLLAASTGFVCPICVVATPLLLGVGGYMKYKEITKTKTQISESVINNDSQK